MASVLSLYASTSFSLVIFADIPLFPQKPRVKLAQCGLVGPTLNLSWFGDEGLLDEIFRNQRDNAEILERIVAEKVPVGVSVPHFFFFL